ncbi:hypothetical protein [Deferribacter abyssi]|uniref:hypothetical protein n=1 Tax=Deferribacter abyssi TaxID=213806 RepID=UPI003C20D585
MENSRVYHKTYGFITMNKKIVQYIKMKNKGMALVTTLILSLVALGFVAAILYMINSSTNISGSHKRYQNTLMAARSAAEYIMDKILIGDENILCNGSLCSDNTTFDLNNLTNDYNINVKVLDKSEDSTTGVTVYSFRVTTTNKNNPKEKSVIEFVFKVE